MGFNRNSLCSSYKLLVIELVNSSLFSHLIPATRMSPLKWLKCESRRMKISFKWGKILSQVPGKFLLTSIIKSCHFSVLNGHILHEAGLGLNLHCMKGFKYNLHREGLEVHLYDVQDRKNEVTQACLERKFPFRINAQFFRLFLSLLCSQLPPITTANFTA